MYFLAKYVIENIDNKKLEKLNGKDKDWFHSS